MKINDPRFCSLAQMPRAILALGVIIGSFITAALAGDRDPQSLSNPSVLESQFSLVDVSGHLFTNQNLRGQWFIVFFGYTSCPDICPTTLFDIASALKELGSDADHVAPIFVTVDPERDTPTVLHEYVSSFDPRIEALTGTPAEIAQAAAIFGVTYFKVAGTNPGEYTMAHSAIVQIINPDGQVVTRFSSNVGAQFIATTLRALIKYGQSNL